MRKLLWVILMLLLLVGCRRNAPAVDPTWRDYVPAQNGLTNPAAEEVISPTEDIDGPTNAAPPAVMETPAKPQDVYIGAADCYDEEEPHPIAADMAELYAAITSYGEIMAWFCNGAEFEDILNALLTEELSGADAEALLLEVAEGKTWEDIWLELGITEE